jgi:hypothetical protein
MATIRRRGTTWQVQVRRQGHSTLSRTFRLKADAEQTAGWDESMTVRASKPAMRMIRLQPPRGASTKAKRARNFSCICFLNIGLMPSRLESSGSRK